MKLSTERTLAILSAAKLPKGQTGFKVPDTAACFDREQQMITKQYKDAFGCSEASYTFKIVEKDNERAIYEPAVINKGGVISVEWGDVTVPLVAKARYSPMSNTVYIILGEGEDSEEYSLRVRTINIKPEEAKTKVQKEFSLLPRESKAEYLQKAWEKGTIVQLLSEGFPEILKLSELKAGEYKIVDYRMNRFDKYEAKLADGRWIRTNTAMGTKFAIYQDMGVEVSPEEPATFTLGVSVSKTATGYAIYPTTLISYRNADIPVFDFGALEPSAVPETPVFDFGLTDPTDIPF